MTLQVPHELLALLPFPELLLPRGCFVALWEWPVPAPPRMPLPAKPLAGNGPMLLTSSTLGSDSVTPLLP